MSQSWTPWVCGWLALGLLQGQTQIDLRTQGKNIDFADAATTRPVKTGLALPAACRSGELFFLTTAIPGQNLYACAATNVWSPLTAGAAAASECLVSRNTATTLSISACSFIFPNRPKVSTSGATVTATGGLGTAFIYATYTGDIRVGHSGTLSISCSGCTDGGVMSLFPNDVARIATWTANATAGQWDVNGGSDQRSPLMGPLQLSPGLGILISTGAYGEKSLAVNAGVVQTKMDEQAGQEILCNGSNSTTAQTCTLTPTLTTYTTGQRIRWRSGAANSSGAITLNVDGLGAKAIKMSDGSSDPPPNSLSAGAYYDLTYDGAVFRLPGGMSTGAVSWGQITGTLSTQTDLQSALNSKAPVSHTHAAGDVTSGLFSPARLGTGTAASSTFLRGDQQWQAVGWGDVTGKPSTFPPTLHSHVLSDLSQSGAAVGQVPQWNGTAWVPATVSGGGAAVSYVQQHAAICQDGAAALSSNLSTANAPLASCATATNRVFGVATFSSGNYIEQSLQLTGGTVTLITWTRRNGTGSSASAQFSHYCADAGDDPDGAYYGSPQTITFTDAAAANRLVKTSTVLTLNAACTAGRRLFWRLTGGATQFDLLAWTFKIE